MTRWETIVVGLWEMGLTVKKRQENAEAALGKMGMDGWELVSATECYMFLKRPLP